MVIDLATGERRAWTHRQVRLAQLYRKRATFFRDVAMAHGDGPTAWTSDDNIIAVDMKVTRAFRQGCRLARKPPPNRWKLNFIVLKFLEVSEVVGAEIVDALLECELKWYLEFGLRKIYDFELGP
ncbi:hypothetical protein [Caballeronia telluris]|nr:hypothetical protein [Caballeronia telluris]